MTGFLSSQRCFETYVGTSVEWRRTWRKATRGAGSCVGPRATRFGSAAPPLEGQGHRGHRVSTSRLLAFLGWGQNLRGPVGSRRGRFLTEETSGAFQRELGMFAAKQTTPSPRRASAGSFALSVDRAHNPWSAPCRTILDPADMRFYVPCGFPEVGSAVGVPTCLKLLLFWSRRAAHWTVIHPPHHRWDGRRPPVTRSSLAGVCCPQQLQFFLRRRNRSRQLALGPCFSTCHRRQGGLCRAVE